MDWMDGSRTDNNGEVGWLANRTYANQFHVQWNTASFSKTMMKSMTINWTCFLFILIFYFSLSRSLALCLTYTRRLCQTFRYRTICCFSQIKLSRTKQNIAWTPPPPSPLTHSLACSVTTCCLLRTTLPLTIHICINMYSTLFLFGIIIENDVQCFRMLTMTHRPQQLFTSLKLCL